MENMVRAAHIASTDKAEGKPSGTAPKASRELFAKARRLGWSPEDEQMLRSIYEIAFALED